MILGCGNRTAKIPTPLIRCISIRRFSGAKATCSNGMLMVCHPCEIENDWLNLSKRFERFTEKDLIVITYGDLIEGEGNPNALDTILTVVTNSVKVKIISGKLFLYLLSNSD